MKHLIILILAVIAIIAIRVFEKFKVQLIIAFLLCITLVSGLYTLRNINGVVSFVRPTNQLFYQSEYLEDGMYPDAILPLIVKDRKVYTKDDIKHFEYDMSGEALWEEDLRDIHYGINSENLLKAFDADTVRDSSMNDAIITDDIQKDFEVLGAANDMLRFSGVVGSGTEEYWNYFHHYYVYTAYGMPMNVYLNVNDMDSELVALWQKVKKGYGENLYIMNKDYYDKNVKP